jgi:hypothetical protein
MTTATTTSVFHQWLISDPASLGSACAIILHVVPPFSTDGLIEEIADYLNEYDDEGEGRWLPATPELVAKISADPNYRQLLGLPESDVTSDDWQEETLAALGKHGRLIFLAPGIGNEGVGLTTAFHAGIGRLPEISKKCHITINPDLIYPQCIGHIIGDVFLEWHEHFRRGASLRQIQ